MKQLVVIDVETGGLDDREHSILSLGAVIWTDGVLSEPFHMFIREENMVTTPDAMRVNGITDNDMAHAMSPSFVVSAFEDWLHSHSVYGRPTLGGHNIAGFDMGFVKRLYKLAGKKFPFDYHVQDTMVLAGALRFADRLSVSNVKLDTLCSHFDIKIREIGTPHNAAEDALATAKLFTALLDILGERARAVDAV
jgi:DNA polymerase III epsilon subunit family exonuclease